MMGVWRIRYDFHECQGTEGHIYTNPPDQLKQAGPGASDMISMNAKALTDISTPTHPISQNMLGDRRIRDMITMRGKALMDTSTPTQSISPNMLGFWCIRYDFHECQSTDGHIYTNPPDQLKQAGHLAHQI